jgi:hypothetical protein
MMTLSESSSSPYLDHLHLLLLLLFVSIRGKDQLLIVAAIGEIQPPEAVFFRWVYGK